MTFCIRSDIALYSFIVFVVQIGSLGLIYVSTRVFAISGIQFESGWQ